MSFARLLVEPEIGQRLASVQIRLAAGDDAEARSMRRIDHRVIQLVGAAVRERGIQLVVEQPRFQFERGFGPADVQSLGRHSEIGRDDDVEALRIDHDRRRRFDHLSHCLHADPDAGIAAHRKAVQAEIEIFLHRRRDTTPESCRP